MTECAPDQDSRVDEEPWLDRILTQSRCVPRIPPCEDDTDVSIPYPVPILPEHVPTQLEQFVSFLVLYAIAVTFISLILPRPIFCKLWQIAFPFMPDRLGDDDGKDYNSAKERKKLDRWHEKRKAKLRKQYPEIHGKKLDYVTHSYEDNDGGGWLYINLYFTDGKNFSMDFSMNNPAIVPRVIEYGDMSTGDYKNIRTYYHKEED